MSRSNGARATSSMLHPVGDREQQLARRLPIATWLIAALSAVTSIEIGSMSVAMARAGPQ